MRFFQLSQSLYTVYRFIVQNCLVMSLNGSSGVCVPLFSCSVFPFSCESVFGDRNPTELYTFVYEGYECVQIIDSGLSAEF